MSYLGLLTRVASALALLIGLSGYFATTSAHAQTIDPTIDPLHGCVTANSTTTCGNYASGILDPGSGNTFSFVPSPNQGQTGTLQLEILVPVSDVSDPSSVSFTVNGATSTEATSSAYGTNVFSGNQMLTTFIGISAQPTMPNSAFNNGAGGVSYYVYQVTVPGTYSPGEALSFSAGSTLLTGTEIVAVLNTGTTGSPNYITTAQSSQIDVVTTPLPAALSLFAGGLGLIGFAGFRKKRKTARLAVA